MTFAEQLKEADGSRFQIGLANFIVDLAPGVVVETGHGVSTLFILQAMDAIGKGRLISVDPAPWYPHAIDHPRLTFVKALAVDALAKIYEETGWWDLFLHDGNHEAAGMTFDLEFGYAALREGGWIVCDDYTWGERPGECSTWNKFLLRHGRPGMIMGSAAMTDKPAGGRWIHRYGAAAEAEAAKKLAQEAAAAHSGPVHPAFAGQ